MPELSYISLFTNDLESCVIEMQNELTHGPVMKTMLRFAVPMILGNLLQQCYNIGFSGRARLPPWAPLFR